jgi:hypothetical protein
VTTQRSTFAKLQRERAKKAKAAAKREKRFDRGGDTDGIEIDVDETPETPRDQYRAEDTIQQLEDLHKRFEAGSISYERFEETKLELFSRLSID